jgi:hypothetical protein
MLGVLREVPRTILEYTLNNPNLLVRTASNLALLEITRYTAIKVGNLVGPLFKGLAVSAFKGVHSMLGFKCSCIDPKEEPSKKDKPSPTDGTPPTQ